MKDIYFVYDLTLAGLPISDKSRAFHSYEDAKQYYIEMDQTKDNFSDWMITKVPYVQ